MMVYAPLEEPRYDSDALRRWDSGYSGSTHHHRRLWLRDVPNSLCVNNGQPGHVPALDPEQDEGPIEYKLRVTITDEGKEVRTGDEWTKAFRQRLAGMIFRLDWARRTGLDKSLWGRATYELGIHGQSAWCISV